MQQKIRVYSQKQAAVLVLFLCWGVSVSSFSRPQLFSPRRKLVDTTSRFERGCPFARRIKEGLLESRRFQRSFLRFQSSDSDGNDADIDEGLDFPGWVNSLRQWPLYPSAPLQIGLADNDDDTEQDIELSLDSTTINRDSVLEPLSSLLNVEALLVANGNDIMDEVLQIEELLETDSKEFPASLDRAALAGSTEETKSFLKNLRELGGLDRWLALIGSDIDAATMSSTKSISNVAGAILNEATSRIDYLVSEASTALSPNVLKDLVERAGSALLLSDGDTLIKAAERLVRDQGLDVSEAANLVAVLNNVLTAGFASNEQDDRRTIAHEDEKVLQERTAPLFSKFASAQLLSSAEYTLAVKKAAEMGMLSGGIYQDTEDKFFGQEHAFVANGTTADVAWIVSDSIDYESNYLNDSKKTDPIFVRTITIRGFDASDETVDREGLLNEVCTATPVPLQHGVKVHIGLLGIARQLYDDLEKYIQMTGPMHRVVLNGHSVGGSLAEILLLLLVENRGAEFVRERILRVFTFGSPPVFEAAPETDNDIGEISYSTPSLNADPYHCPVLSSYGLPSDMVYGYLQPWDPVIRLFSSIDPLYPLVGDLGEDGKTLYASGPPRTLRPVTRAIIESWGGWPRFRETARNTGDQNFTSIGVQHIFLPDPLRYVSDRLVSANVRVPPIDSIMRISNTELLPSLKEAFPMDTFRISFVPTAIRSFVHHFYPAYDATLMDYAIKTDPKPTKASPTLKQNSQFDEGDLQPPREISASFLPTDKIIASEEQVGDWSPGNWLQFRS